MGNCHFKTDFDAENITGKTKFSFNNLINPIKMKQQLKEHKHINNKSKLLRQ